MANLIDELKNAIVELEADKVVSCVGSTAPTSGTAKWAFGAGTAQQTGMPTSMPW
jgi:hypothetical protein